MALLPNDYYILLICPEVVIISDKHCINPLRNTFKIGIYQSDLLNIADS